MFLRERIPQRFAAAIVDTPDFHTITMSYLETYIAWQRTLGAFRQAISSNVRQRLTARLLYLHFKNDSGVPDNGASVERLFDPSIQANSSEAIGTRALRNFVALSQRSGHLTVVRGQYDRRLKILIPSEKWVAQEVCFHEAALASLGLLGIEQGSIEKQLRGAELLSKLAVAAGHRRAVGVVLGQPDGDLGALASLTGGLAVALTFAYFWGRGKIAPPATDFHVNFGVSVSQVHRILRLAAHRSLVTVDARGRLVDGTALVAAVRRIVAHELCIYVHCLSNSDTVMAESSRESASIRLNGAA